MKKIMVIVLLIIFVVGSTCYAKNPGQIYNVDNSAIALERTQHPVELCDKQRHAHGHKHHKENHKDKHHKKHHKHKDHDDELGDIIAGIIIYEVVKDILD